MKASEREEAKRERELLSQLEQLGLHRKKTQELLASGKLQPVQQSRLQDLLGQVQGDVERTKAELASVRLQEELRRSEMVHRERESGRFTLYRVLFIALLAVFLAAGLYSALHAGDVTSAAVAVTELSTPKEHYLASEQPFFVVDMPEKEAALTGFFALSPLKVQLRDPLGRVAEVEQGIQKKGKARYVSFSPTASFRPGKYSLQLVQEGTVVQEQNFTWGVLALNPDKSAYRSGDKAFISMAVLDDQGSMVCDADVIMEIIAPDGVKTEFSTREGSIMVSEECKLYGITALPDYYTSYTAGMGEGNYALNVTATLPDGKKRTVMDVLRVNNSAPFYVARKGPTRIYPYDAYRMEISVEAQQEFSGEIRELVPESFLISTQEGMQQRPFKDTTVLSWDISVSAGETKNISYTFDAPDLSPEMYLLGPLRLIDEDGRTWEENRQWQIASDALTGVTLNTPVADLSNVTGQEFTFTCTPTCNGVGDPASVVINYQYSSASDCSAPTYIDTNSGTTDVLSVDAQNDSTTCGAAITGLVTARNVGTVYVTCRSEAMGEGPFTGGCRQVAIAQGCGTISSNLNMNQNLSSSGTCFTINANHIIINCTNYGVNYGGGGSANTYGVDNNGFDNVTIKNCVIQEATATGTDKHGIFLQNGAIGTEIFNSSMRASGQSSQGISLQSGSNSTNITDIRVDTTGVNGAGMLFFHSSHNIITNAIVKTSAGTGILLASAHNNTFEALNATVTGQTQAVRIFDFSVGGTGMTNNIFLNLTAWSAVNYTLFDDSGITANNTLIYNSTFGVINWTLSNLTTNMTLWQGLTIFVENRTIGVRDEGALMERINTSAKIVFRTLQYLVTPLLLKRGERCDDTIHCNITQNYDKAVGVLTANVSSFSNYTLNSPPTQNVPILNTTDVTVNGTNQNITLYWQNASDPDRDSIKNITNWLVNGTSIMVLNMPFERVNGTSTNNAWDYSGYRNNGSDQGATWNSSGGYDGKGAYDFDSIDDYIHLGNVLGELVGGDQLTIMAWINHESGTGIQYIIVKNGPFIFYIQDSLLRGAIYNGTSWTYQVTNGKFRDQAWEHVAMTYNGSAIGMYINGKLNTTGVKTGALTGAGCVEIGRYNTGTCGASPANYFNGTIDELKIYNRSLSAEQILALYNNRTDLIVSQETTSGQNWTADVTPNDGFSDGAPLRSNQVIVLGNTLPTAPVTGMPFNDSSITNRTPIFEWFNSSDADGEVISYHLQVDDNQLFNNPEINVSAIQDLSSSAPGNTTWYSSLGTTELAVDTRYFWRVRANDSSGFGAWSDGSNSADGLGGGRNLSNFTVDSLLSVTLFTSVVEFGSLAPGAQENTSDASPGPFRAENSGNIDVNTSINGSQYFDNAQLNTSNYQFRIRENNSNAFATALSDTNWRNMSKNIFAPNVVNLTWRSSKRDFLVDINVTVPTDEPSGVKRSIVTFTVVANQ